jgi:hypothetical protein
LELMNRQAISLGISSQKITELVALSLGFFLSENT